MVDRQLLLIVAWGAGGYDMVAVFGEKEGGISQHLSTHKASPASQVVVHPSGTGRKEKKGDAPRSRGKGWGFRCFHLILYNGWVLCRAGEQQVRQRLYNHQHKILKRKRKEGQEGNVAMSRVRGTRI